MLLISVFVILVGSLGSAEKTVCYYGSWSVYRQPRGTFDVNNIDPFICTDLVFGFAGINSQTWEIKVLDPWNELCPADNPPGNNCAYDRFVALKNQNPALTITLSVGGWNENSNDYSVMAADPVKRQIFISSTVKLLQDHGFDGLDLDWEYPTQRGGMPEDKANFVTLLAELRSTFDSLNPRFILTAAVGAGKSTIDPSYDVPGMANSLDFFHLMTYDYHGSWETITGHHAPLCGDPLDPPEFMYDRVDFSLSYYIQLGAPREKIVLGTAAYGRCWTLNNPAVNGMYAPADNPSPAGPYTGTPGTLDDLEICERMLAHNCPVVHDPNLNEPYLYCPDDGVWCGYEDEDSVYKKARYAKNRGLAGVLIWTIDEEDFIPECSSVAFPLIKKINQALSEAPDAVPFECPN